MSDRTAFVGSSDVAPILGLSPWKTPLDVYFAKLGELDGKETPATRRGKFLELALIARYAHDNGTSISEIAFDHSAYRFGWRHAQLDGLLPDRTLEAKTVGRHAYRHGDWGDAGTDQIPEAYLCQVQWGLDLAQRDRADVVVAVLPDDPDDVLGLTAAEVIEVCDVITYSVRRHQGIIDAMVERCAHFWNVNVQKRIPPDPTTYAEAEALYWKARHKGAAIPATDEMVQWLTALQFGRELEKRGAAIIERAKFNLAEFMKDHEVLTGPDGKSPWLEWKEQERKGFTVAPAKYKTMRLGKWWNKTAHAQFACDAARQTIDAVMQPLQPQIQETRP